MNLFEYYCLTDNHCVYKLTHKDGKCYYGKTNNALSRYRQHCAKSGSRNEELEKRYRLYGNPEIEVLIDGITNDMAIIIEWIFINLTYKENLNVANYPYLKNKALLCLICSILGLSIELKHVDTNGNLT